SQYTALRPSSVGAVIAAPAPIRALTGAARPFAGGRWSAGAAPPEVWTRDRPVVPVARGAAPRGESFNDTRAFPNSARPVAAGARDFPARTGGGPARRQSRLRVAAGLVAVLPDSTDRRGPVGAHPPQSPFGPQRWSLAAGDRTVLPDRR